MTGVFRLPGARKKRASSKREDATGEDSKPVTTEPKPTGRGSPRQSSRKQTVRAPSLPQSDEVNELATISDESQDAAEETSAVILTPSRPLVRTANARAKKAATVLAAVKRFRKQRPDDHLSSLMAEMRELNISRKNPGQAYARKDILSAVGENILAAAGKKVGDDLYYPDIRGSDYTLGHVSPIRYLSRLVRPNTTAIMELGSGWSANLFQLYIAHGVTRSRKIIYYGGEDTREGQICAKFIAGGEPGLSYRSFQFDFLKPNVEFLQRQRGHILLFTSHSIEQVEVINPALFEQLREIPNPVTVVHFEPVGWQRDPELIRARERNDVVLFETIGSRTLAGDLTSPTENAAWWSWRLDYNTNLLSIVRDLERQNAVTISRLEFDFDGVGNVLNPTSLIHYDFVR